MNLKLLVNFIFFVLLTLPLTGQCKPIFIGDSLTYEIAVSYSRKSPVDAKFLESTGLQSTKILHWQNYIQTVNLSGYDTVYVVLGTNDLISKADIPQYQQKASLFIRSIKKQNTNIVWLLPPALKHPAKNTLLNNTRQAIQRACYQENIHIVDMKKLLGTVFTTSIDGVSVRTQDGIHITRKGADLITNYLRKE